MPLGVSMSASVLAAGSGSISFIFNGALEGLGNGPISTVSWDGTNSNGQLVASGQYYAKIQAVDGFGNSVSLVSSITVIRTLLVQSLTVYNSAGEVVAQVPLTSTAAISRFDVPQSSKVLELDPATGLPLSGFPIVLVQGDGTQIQTQWNGLNAQGVPVGPGLYTMELYTQVPGQAAQRLSKEVQVLTAPSNITLGQPFAAPQPYVGGPLAVFFTALPSGQEVHARLYNAAGELVLNSSGPGDTGRLDIGNVQKLAGGVYVVELTWVRGAGVMERKMLKVAVAR